MAVTASVQEFLRRSNVAYSVFRHVPAYSAQRDGTPGNPPGTAATRTFDRAAGTNASGAYPSQSDGTPGNPPGTAAGRTIDRTTGSSTPSK